VVKSLLRGIRACTVCRAALPHGPRPIVAADAAAKVLIIGQAPGRRVHESGVPWQDPSGDRLRDWLGVDETTFYGHQVDSADADGLLLSRHRQIGRPAAAVRMRAVLASTVAGGPARGASDPVDRAVCAEGLFGGSSGENSHQNHAKFSGSSALIFAHAASLPTRPDLAKTQCVVRGGTGARVARENCRSVFG
jgi:hypothetical protein